MNIKNNKTGAVLVVGGGIAGIQSSLDLANSGFKVFLVEDSPAIGGIMSQLDKTFPTNDCAMCIISPKLVEFGRHLNIEFLPSSEIEEVTGKAGDFKVKIFKRPRFIDIDKCTGCGECEKACPVHVVSEFDESLVDRKAVFRLYPQAYPNAFAIDKKSRPQCQKTCPAGTHAQGYIALIREKKYKEAYNLIRENLPFPAICGRVCHHPCEDKCKRGEYDEPIAIMNLKRFISDYVFTHKEELQAEEPKNIEKKEEKIAIIGAGPSGLACAYFLTNLGYPVTIFEATEKPGGMMRMGIPPYRLPRDQIEWEINEVLKNGVELKTNTPITSKKDFEKLEKEGYKAFFLAVGAQKGKALRIGGTDLPGAFLGLEFLKSVNTGEEVKIGKKIAIIGGGNVAIDVARCSLRLGASEVHLACLESRREMPAHEWEIEAAVEERVKLHPSWGPKRIVGEDGKIRRLDLIKCTSVFDSEGRFSPKVDENIKISIECDTVIIAIGQVSDFSFLEETGVNITRYGTIACDPVTLATDVNGFFAGGDAVKGPASVVEAVGQGHEAAISIDRFLRGDDIKEGRGESTEELPSREISKFIEKKERQIMPVLPVEERIKDFKEIDLGFTEGMALEEVDRCLECGLCSECLECERVCEADAVLHSMTGEHLEINVGSIILALGADKFNPSIKHEYGYGKHRNVITSIQFERILAASGPYQGHVQRPSDGKLPKRIAWIQCVGSRDEDSNNLYCSSVCCMYALKETIIAKEHVKDIEPTIFFMDIRAHGKDFDKYYEKAKQDYGVRFIRSRVGKIEEAEESGNVLVYYTKEDGKQLSEEFDLVVLSVGFKPSEGIQALSDKFGVRLNAHNFFKTARFLPIETTRDGIFICGTSSSPKDIPETVMQASGSAASAAELLSDVRGTEIVEKTYPPERDLSGESPRIGVFVCHCGINIGNIVDVPQVVEYAKTLPGVTYAEDNLFTCSQDTQQKMKQVIEEHNLNRVVVASCSPRTHEPLFQETLKESGLNPRLFEMANIRDQCSWVHMNEPKKATEKAKYLVRMAVSKSRLLEPLPIVELDVIQKGLVIGGGLAGMEVALSIAEQGFEVSIVEREKELGGNLRSLYYTIQGGDVQEYLHSLIEKVENHPKVKVYKEASIENIEGYIGNYKTRIVGAPVDKSSCAPEDQSTGAQEHWSNEIEHGIIVVTTGAEELKQKEYLYGEDEQVITQFELEERLASVQVLQGTSASVEKKKKIAKDRSTKAPKHWKTVVMIQCVGSRDDEHPYCSRVCCQEAIKNALKLKELNPKVDIYILYRDVRTYGFFEEYYQKARDNGITFIRYEEEEKPVVETSTSEHRSTGTQEHKSNGLRVKVKDPILGSYLVIEPDLVVLAPAIVPRADAPDISQMLKVPLNEDKFFLEAHVKLRPVDFSTEGVFLAGLAHSPKTIDETISQSKAAAARACTIISKDKYEAEAITASVNENVCSGCGMCVSVCPYDAPQVVEKEGKRLSQINKAMCKGCGNCASACPSGAMQQLGFKSEQTLVMIDAALESISAIIGERLAVGRTPQTEHPRPKGMEV